MKIIITEEQLRLLKENKNDYNDHFLNLLNSGEYELANILMEGQNIDAELFFTNLLSKKYMGGDEITHDFTFNVVGVEVSSDWWNNGFFVINIGDIEGSYMYYDGEEHYLNIQDYIDKDPDNKDEILDIIFNTLINEFNFLDNLTTYIKYN